MERRPFWGTGWRCESREAGRLRRWAGQFSGKRSVWLPEAPRSARVCAAGRTRCWPMLPLAPKLQRLPLGKLAMKYWTSTPQRRTNDPVKQRRVSSPFPLSYSSLWMLLRRKCLAYLVFASITPAGDPQPLTESTLVQEIGAFPGSLSKTTTDLDSILNPGLPLTFCIVWQPWEAESPLGSSDCRGRCGRASHRLLQPPLPSGDSTTAVLVPVLSRHPTVLVHFRGPVWVW